ncbi:MAG: hypothetical protein ABI639_15365 [Thermoanaerobaculia bacterium]
MAVASLTFAVATLFGAANASATTDAATKGDSACRPCSGIVVEDPFAVATVLAAAPRLEKDARLFVGWDAPLDGTASPAAAHALAGAGATPWLRLHFNSPAPLLEHLDALQRELDAAVELARLAPPGTRFEIVWEGPGTALADARQYAFLFKRAAVAVSGVQTEAQVFSQALPPDPAWLKLWYGEEIAAYVDGVSLAAGSDDELAATVAELTALDPGKPIVVEGIDLPTDARLAVASAAKLAASGIAIPFFRSGTPTDSDLAPLKVMANEFRGELEPDSGTTPTGGAGAWSFVRGEDLGLRVVVASPGTAAGATPAPAATLALSFPDPQLRTPFRIDLLTGVATPLAEPRRSASATEIRLGKPQSVELLRLARPTAAELEGVTEEVTIASEREIPVEEILRRLQGFEDAQARHLLRYQAVNATTLRFQAASGVQTVEATFEGEFFFRQGKPFDWAWQNFYVNGVKWRGKTIPELPLIQPEKAAAMPLEILFTKDYRYTLRGKANVDGRECWVVDFEPAVPVEGKNLYRGTVWIDRAIGARVRSRAVQLGLQGEVLSNEETIDYTPVDETGNLAAWNGSSYFLPLKVTAQQIVSILNTATVIEKEVKLTSVQINGPEFDQRREEILASDSTMVRDTDKGFRYLVKDATGERAVKETFDTDRLFLLGGTFYDDSLDYPLPLIGINYFNFNAFGKKHQLNAFFGGVLGILNYANPRLFGSKFDLGLDVFGIAIASSDQLFRNEVEQSGEEVKDLPARINVNIGHPIGSFVKWSGTYQIAYDKYSRADNTATSFVLPSDHLTHSLSTGFSYSRSGYRLDLSGAYHQRSKWEPWGLLAGPASETTSSVDAFDPDTKDYKTWQFSASKSWYLANFRKIGVQLEYLGGSELDRFSKYQFGFFGSARVHGYQIGKVRAEEAELAHVTYGFELGELLRIDAVADAAWATDKASGLDNELLAGVGIAGTFMGPWETLINLDIGTPVAGPDDGLVAYIVFLKLFH